MVLMKNQQNFNISPSDKKFIEFDTQVNTANGVQCYDFSKEAAQLYELAQKEHKELCKLGE